MLALEDWRVKARESTIMPESSEALLSEATKLLASALDLLDRAEAPGDIGAYVDLALQRLRDVLGASDSDS
jgi:hypothetical protein